MSLFLRHPATRNDYLYIAARTGLHGYSPGESVEDLVSLVLDAAGVAIQRAAFPLAKELLQDLQSMWRKCSADRDIIDTDLRDQYLRYLLLAAEVYSVLREDAICAEHVSRIYEDELNDVARHPQGCITVPFRKGPVGCMLDTTYCSLYVLKMRGADAGGRNEEAVDLTLSVLQASGYALNDIVVEPLLNDDALWLGIEDNPSLPDTLETVLLNLMAIAG